jgi:hypothetical protein
MAIVLMLLLTLAYFTHLVAFLLAVAGALLAVALTGQNRLVGLALVLLAALPGACLAMDYFVQTGFYRARSAMRVVYQPLDRLQGQRWDKGALPELAAIDDELFAYHAGPVTAGCLVLVYCGLLAGFTIAGAFRQTGEPHTGAGWLFPVVFGTLLFAGFLLVPNDLGRDHGSFLKARLAVVLPLVWLGCFREPAELWGRLLVRGLAVVLVVGNLALATQTVAAGNQELRQYTAGIAAAGTGHRLFAVQGGRPRSPLVDHLLHAAGYYCLGTGNVNLDNYEASTLHFPVTYRKGLKRGPGDRLGFARPELVDVVLHWRTPGGGPDGWDEVFREGPLRIYRRPGRQ